MKYREFSPYQLSSNKINSKVLKYKQFSTKIFFHKDEKVWKGTVVEGRHVLCLEGRTKKALKLNFKKRVDQHLKTLDEVPEMRLEKPLKYGNFEGDVRGEIGELYGWICGIDRTIEFNGATMEELKTDFKKKVNQYIKIQNLTM